MMWRKRLSALGMPTIGAAFLILLPAETAPAANAVELAPHRAVYDLKLVSARGNRPVESVRGRILYDFDGNPCEGYALQFRQVSELTMGEGNSLFTDLRAATWEDGQARTFRFNSQNYMNEKLVDTVDGTAERRPSAIDITLSKPGSKQLSIEPEMIFPTEHMRRIIEAARAGRSILEVPVYDGSESGEKTYNTLTVIGKPIAPESRPDDPTGKDAAFAGKQRWPVRISYFDKGKSGGEQMPVYAIGFELFDNGIARALVLDYNDFVISGDMANLEMRSAEPCR